MSRVPAGNQRSTYFLHLPCRFGLPLVLFSGILHWLASQSMFVVAIDFYNFQGVPDNVGEDRVGWPDVKTYGFSPIAIFSVIVYGDPMLATIVGF